jgi:hypothetical protein
MQEFDMEKIQRRPTERNWAQKTLAASGYIIPLLFFISNILEWTRAHDEHTSNRYLMNALAFLSLFSTRLSGY